MIGWHNLFMIINATDFIYGGELFYKNPRTGECYQLYDPPAFSNRENGNKILKAEPIRPSIYNEYLDNCIEVKMKWEGRHA
jgi:hypothetical protein